MLVSKFVKYFAIISFCLATQTVVIAHCDTMDGPVVRAAKQALKTRNSAYVLIWVQAQDESQVKEAFRQTLAVRILGPSARALADKYFFETVVRIHRTGEGQPYTGLKPAGTDLGPVIPVADRAIETGIIDSLLNLFPKNTQPDIVAKFQDVFARKIFNRNDVSAGRQYVAAYTQFLEYVERLYEENAARG